MRDARLHLLHGLAEAVGLLARRAQDVKCEALGAFCADAGQPLQLLDQSDEWLGMRHDEWACAYMPGMRMPPSIPPIDFCISSSALR